MKKIKKVIAFLLVLMSATVYFGCDTQSGFNPPAPENESKRIEIKVLFDGYGTSWADAMVKRFNEIWGDEGYEAVVTQADPQLTVVNDFLTPKKNTTDIFFEYNHINQLVERSRSIYKNDNCLLEDLTDVFNSRPLNANKEEEGEKNIIDRMDPFIKKATSYTGQLKGYNGQYGFPWHGGTVGLYVNMGAVTSRGYTSDDLLTTDRLITMVNAMKPADLLDADAFFPVSWSANKAPGYWDYMFQTLLGQYIGGTEYENIYNFIPAEGTVVDNGFSVYNNDGIVKALDVIAALLDKDLAVPGTSSLDHVQAQARVFRGTSAMMVSGDWMFKECAADYGDYLENVTAVKMPVISELGVKLDLLGTGDYSGSNRKNCDDILAAIVKDVDGGTLTDAQIAEKHATVSEEKVATIRQRRNTVYGASNWFYNQAHIPAYSDAKTGAKLFLRFMYSDEGMSIYKRETYVDLPSEYTNEPSHEGYTNFMESLTAKTSAPDTTMLIPDAYSTTLRASSSANIPFFPGYSGAQMYADLSYSHSTSSPQLTVAQVFEKINKEIKAEWDMYLRTAGLA